MHLNQGHCRALPDGQTSNWSLAATPQRPHQNQTHRSLVIHVELLHPSQPACIYWQLSCADAAATQITHGHMSQPLPTPVASKLSWVLLFKLFGNLLRLLLPLSPSAADLPQHTRPAAGYAPVAPQPPKQPASSSGLRILLQAAAASTEVSAATHTSVL